MKFFIDLSDERNICLMNIIKHKNVEVYDLTEFDTLNPIAVVFSPAKKLTTDDLILFPDKSIIFSGNIDDKTKELLKNKNFIYKNFMQDEIFSIKNANLTAEGVLALILTESKKSIFESNILIFGAGRISKACAILFNKLGVNFSICNYHDENYKNAYIFCNSCYLGKEYAKDASRFDIIINTIPSLHLSKLDANLFKSGTMYIETASQNGTLRENSNLNFIPAPQLPKRFSCESAAKVMYDFINKEL